MTRKFFSYSALAFLFLIVVTGCRTIQYKTWQVEKPVPDSPNLSTVEQVEYKRNCDSGKCDNWTQWRVVEADLLNSDGQVVFHDNSSAKYKTLPWELLHKRVLPVDDQYAFIFKDRFAANPKNIYDDFAFQNNGGRYVLINLETGKEVPRNSDEFRSVREKYKDVGAKRHMEKLAEKKENEARTAESNKEFARNLHKIKMRRTIARAERGAELSHSEVESLCSNGHELCTSSRARLSYRNCMAQAEEDAATEYGKAVSGGARPEDGSWMGTYRQMVASKQSRCKQLNPDNF